MRLIDIDKLFKTLNKLEIPFYADINNAINSQPTAYNVDKVVEQLEEQKMWYETHGVNKDMNKGIIGATCKAIEIVKRGGLDE